MLGTINSPRHWPKDEPLSQLQMRLIDKTLPAYGPNSDPRLIPSKDGRDGMRVAMGLSNAAAMSAGEPIGIRALL